MNGLPLAPCTHPNAYTLHIYHMWSDNNNFCIFLLIHLLLFFFTWFLTNIIIYPWHLERGILLINFMRPPLRYNPFNFHFSFFSLRLLSGPVPFIDKMYVVSIDLIDYYLMFCVSVRFCFFFFFFLWFSFEKRAIINYK